MMTAALPSDAWITLGDVKTILGPDAPTTPEGDAALQLNIDSAVELLYSLSGRQFPGTMSSTVRPTSKPSYMPVDTWASQMRVGLWSSGWNASWLWGICSGCHYAGCCNPDTIGLGRSPVISVEQVQIDANILDPSEYQVYEQKWLTRMTCCDGWPTCQRLSCPVGDPCTFEVQFTWGQDPPQIGKTAAGKLSSELYKADQPGLACTLPQRITSITRQGVSIAILDPQTFLDKGLTGNYQIDIFIKAYNPGGQVRRPTVFSPDVINTARKQTYP
jgi:hypothetical protein